MSAPLSHTTLQLCPIVRTSRRWLVVALGSNLHIQTQGWWRTHVVELPRHRNTRIDALSLFSDVEEGLRWIGVDHDIAPGRLVSYQVVEEQPHVSDDESADEYACYVGDWTPACMPALAGTVCP